MRSFQLVMAGVVFSLVADLSRAAESGFYMGAAVAEAETREKIGLGDAFDDRDSSFKIIGGWRPVDWFAVEGSYFDLGRVRLRRNVPDLSPFRLDQKGYGAFGVFLLEIASFDLFAKAGIVRSSADFTTNTLIGPLSWTDRDTDLAWGIGGQARFGRLAARLEFERLEISNGEDFRRPRLVSFGLTWTFAGD